MVVTKKDHINFSEESQHMGQELNPGPPSHKKQNY
jgi:hypothetical protein